MLAGIGGKDTSSEVGIEPKEQWPRGRSTLFGVAGMNALLCVTASAATTASNKIRNMITRLSIASSTLGALLLSCSQVEELEIGSEHRIKSGKPSIIQ